jgi:pre-mRNA-splicing factor SPF27
LRAAKTAAQALIDAELRQTPQIADDDARLPPTVEVFAVSTIKSVLTKQSAPLIELLANYTSVRGIDPAKYNIPILEDGASLEELEEAEKRGRIGEGHMGVRQVI